MKRYGLNRAMSTVLYKLEGKVKKKLMIVLLVAAGMIILYHALFYRAKMYKSDIDQLEKEYGMCKFGRSNFQRKSSPNNWGQTIVLGGEK